MKKTKDLVLTLLEKYPSTRGNDNELYYQFFKAKYGTTDLNDIRKSTTDEFVSVVRYRRLLQKLNPFLLPSKNVQKQRLAREGRFKEELCKY